MKTAAKKTNAKHTKALEVYEGGNFVNIGTPGYVARSEKVGHHGYDVGGRASAMLRHGFTDAEFATALADMRLFAQAPAMHALISRLANYEPDRDDLAKSARAILAAIEGGES